MIEIKVPKPSSALGARAWLLFEPYKDFLCAKTIGCEQGRLGNDLYWFAEWADGKRHGVQVRECIPPGGVTNELLQEWTDQAVRKLRQWRDIQ